MLGLFFADATEFLTDDDYLKATWLEIKVADPIDGKARLQSFGVPQADYPDPNRFYFRLVGKICG
jgi:hypothetical protein